MSLLDHWLKKYMEGTDWHYRSSNSYKLHVSGECQACAHWKEDLGFCKKREEIGWKPDDGCIKWLSATR